MFKSYINEDTGKLLHEQRQETPVKYIYTHSYLLYMYTCIILLRVSTFLAPFLNNTSWLLSKFYEILFLQVGIEKNCRIFVVNTCCVNSSRKYLFYIFIRVTKGIGQDFNRNRLFIYPDIISLDVRKYTQAKIQYYKREMVSNIHHLHVRLDYSII